MNAKLVIGAAGLPEGFKLCKEETIRHPVDGMLGALVKGVATGLYFHISGGVIRPIDQWAAREMEGKHGTA